MRGERERNFFSNLFYIMNKLYLLILLFFILIISYCKDKYLYFFEYDNDYFKTTRNWVIVYDKYLFLNKPLKRLNHKIIAHDIMKDLGIKVPKIYYYGSIDDVDIQIFNKKAYVIKPEFGHTSMNVFLIHNERNIFDNKLYKYSDFKKIFRKSQDDYIGTMSYNNIIIEEFILNHDSKEDEYKVNDDFKIFVFKGHVEIILRKIYKNGEYHTIFYNNKCEIIEPLRSSVGKPNNYNIELDKTILKNLCVTAEYIGKKVFSKVFTRLDFYVNNKSEIIFGEVTPNPFNGKGFNNNGIKLLKSFAKKYDLKYDFL